VVPLPAVRLVGYLLVELDLLAVLVQLVLYLLVEQERLALLLLLVPPQPALLELQLDLL
jgi:hypothetical protein